MFVWCFLALLTLAPVATGTNPGIIFRLTEKALNYGLDTLKENLEEILKIIKIPDINFSHLKCDFAENHINLAKSAVKFVPKTGLTLSAEGVIINLRGRFKCLSLDQDYIASGKRLTFAITIAMENDNGHPAMRMTQCNLNPGTIETDIGWFTTWVIKGSMFLFKNVISSKACSWLRDSQIPAFNNILATKFLDASMKTKIDMSMVGDPEISKTSLDLPVKGYNNVQNEEPPRFSFPQYSQETGNMFYIGVSAFSINSFICVHHSAGVLRFDITDDMIPSGLPFRLSTTTFGAFIPNIADRYPDQMIKLSIRTDKSPVIKFRNKNAVVEASSTVTVYVIESNNNESPLFDLSLEASANVHLDVTEQKLTGTVTLDRIGAEIKNNTELGEFGVEKLEEFLTNVIKQFVIPIINAHLQKGYSLPLQPFPLPSSIGTIEPVNIQVQVLNDYLLIGTDVKFTVQNATREER